MALSNQSDLPALFNPQKVNLKLPINSGLHQDVKHVCMLLLPLRFAPSDSFPCSAPLPSPLSATLTTYTDTLQYQLPLEGVGPETHVVHKITNVPVFLYGAWT
jgi:hypothetical protein